jgi:methionine synthase II (cobalamin-independent)
MSDSAEIPEQKSEEKERGRPTIYSQELADEICTRLSHGETLRTIIASSPHLPGRTTIYRWNADNESFRNQYTKARAEQADYYAELIVDESYSSHDAAIGRLRVDALKWAASKMAPKKYGDKIEIDTAQPLTLAFQLPSRATERIELESNQKTIET